ncbi:MAG TPA: 2-hydroxyacyl-CoA dehydratase family protein [Smithellaceae bacterium]|jgi:benzoyl-CoA reductase/2-hydroxyglutaryl-CoA dehydratase subunit BcrC/BadD/HgdB|nr:2-hydroxyacyl-CoA dehydratase [Syntrophaceae bacterium]NMC90172.1 2-hydroxyacyl-CoA dehydratase [Smithella sp.]OQC74208.1 MAG: R-phenyllactate dehydratase subunit alpha precursor [Deltaproteobacteria bacterium ADurb.Bin002]HNV56520.1 2-hydroxyacyl-CoA dehydratase family protein [Smithellaceae bacterium]MBP8667059.1 2-hydroxyacyl-CoA dehydratase [Syntrophaceae bacterium]
MANENTAKSGHQKTAAGRRLSKIMFNDYMNLHQKAGEGAFVVWMAIVVPAELFSGFENVVYGVPESHAAMSAGKGVGPLQCEKAEKMGYSMDLCSYARIDLGTAFDGGKDSPTMGLPKPHLIVSNNNNCSLLVKWFDIYHRTWGVPHFILDVPFCYEPQNARDLDYIVTQYRDLIRTIENLSGQTFNIERVREALENTRDALANWKRFLKTAASRPAGLTAFDSFVQMAPYLTSRGTKTLADHYRLLAEEAEDNIAKGIYPVPNERYRLLWDNIAPWHQLSRMSSRLASLDVNLISASYTYCIGTVEGELDLFAYDGGDPLVYLARMQNSSICPHGMSLRFRAMRRAIEDWGVDGVIFASNRSCKVYSIMQMDMLKRVTNELGIPAVMIDVDHADMRKYSEEQSFTRIEALLEVIDARRKEAKLS